MNKRTLIFYLPSVHRGYVDFLHAIKDKTGRVYLLDPKVLAELGDEKPPLHSLRADEAQDILRSLGFKNVEVADGKTLLKLKKEVLFLVADDVSRALAEKYFKKSDIEWHNVFLRWDRGSVMSATPPDADIASGKKYNGFMRAARGEAEKSGDWWRQVGAILVGGDKILLRAHNSGCPNDQTLYQDGQVRDYMKVGEKPEFANTIHAEQSIIAQAAKKGMTTKGKTLYVTHFPCPVCAKLIVYSGIKKIYFSEGSSVVDAKIILDAFSVDIFQVK